MPRKKKNGQSPARVPGMTHGTDGASDAGDGRTMARSDRIRGVGMGLSNFSNTSSAREETLNSMREMFSHLDPEVIYMVLSECDFQVEVAMDSLLELSGAAEGVNVPPFASGFESAAALLGPKTHTPVCLPWDETGVQGGWIPAASGNDMEELDVVGTHLTKDFDELIDNALETLSDSFLPALPHCPSPRDLHSGSCSELPELIKSSLDNRSKSQWHNSTAGHQHVAKASELPETINRQSPVSGLSFTGTAFETDESSLLDFSHLTMESGNTKPVLDLLSSERPSAFQAYKSSRNQPNPSAGEPDHSRLFGNNPGSAEQDFQLSSENRTMANSLRESRPPAAPLLWNTQAPEFQPRSEEPAFVTPILKNPVPWNHSSSVRIVPSITQSRFRTAFLPQSWVPPHPLRPPLHRSARRPVLVGQVLVLLRGAPGSGKSTLARNLLDQNPGGVVLSTDDYFCRNKVYQFDSTVLGEAHEWNHQRAREAFRKGLSPVIIDNTNMQVWEMKPYVAMALQHCYKVIFREPDTWWKSKPRELERRTKHGVHKEKIKRMLEHYEPYVTVHSIMRSASPKEKEETDHVLPCPEENGLPESIKSEVRPDLVEEPPCKPSPGKSDFPLLPLPDVSSVGDSVFKEERLGQSSFIEPPGSKGCAQTEETSDTDLQPDQHLNTCTSDSEPAAHSLASDKSETLTLSTEFGLDDSAREPADSEVPTAFFESIGQRVRRKRHRGPPTEQGNELVMSDAAEKLSESEQENRIMCAPSNPMRPELLKFVGDWPSELVLEQRQHRSRKALELQGSSKESDGQSNGAEEEQELDFLQGGEDTSQEYKSPTLVSPDSDFPKDSLETIANEQVSGGNCSSTDINVKKVVCTLAAGESRPELLNFVSDCPTGSAMTESQQREEMPNTKKQSRKELDSSQEINPAGDDGSEEPHDVISDAEEVRCSEEHLNLHNTLQKQPEATEDTKYMPLRNQDRKLKQSRRAGKQCKLALTFTNNSPTSPKSLTLSPQIPQFDDPTLDFVSKCVTSLSTQTTPQDFVLLWKVDRQTADVSGVKVFQGNSFNFKPKSAAFPRPQEVPYRVVHDKGAQVDECELHSDDKLKNLMILSSHFKFVSFEILKDLYEKCDYDMEWATNLLLDSGEQLFKDDEVVCSNQASAATEVLSTAGCNADASSSCPEEMSPALTATDDEHLGTLVETISNDIVGPTQEGKPNIEEGQSSPEEHSTGSSGIETDMVRSLEDCQCMLPEDDKHSASQSTGEDSTNEQPLEPKQMEVDHDSEEESKTHNQSEPCNIRQCDEDLGASLNPAALGEVSGGEEGDWTEANSLAFAASFLRLSDPKKEDSPTKKPREKPRHSLDIQSLELRLPAELAFQLSELFGPVGTDPGSLSLEDCVVQIDLNLAKLLHQKWKDTIQERQRQEALSYQLLEESAMLWSDPQSDRANRVALETSDGIPFMDHWSAQMPLVSLRSIMLEEMALQEYAEKSKINQDLGRKDSAALLKEKELYKMFPTIDRHFLMDIFKDNNYSLEQTEQFLRSVLDAGPVKNVIAQDVGKHSEAQRPGVKEKKKKVKEAEVAVQFQDTEDPDYGDFRAEALLQHRKQQECFCKAAEAYRQGKKDVATFYAQQGHHHGQKKKEANHRAAMRIFERVNASLLPQNVLDLHGLHVDEAIHHLKDVLQDKMAEWQQNRGKPHLSVITGRGNRSQGGVARIKPAVIDYLTNHNFRFTEPKAGLLVIFFNK
ncbi:N4BP2 protein, partial [Amia calva]|nr:N4BP2 protein [Amia calva]